MKAVVFRRHGGPEVLEHTEVSDPTPARGQVLVRVKACGLNHLDIWIRQGIPAYRIPLPHISGCDVAGVIERLGDGVKGPRVGDQVVLAPGLSDWSCAWCRAGPDNACANYGIRGAATDGGYAGLVCAEARDVLALPDGLSFEEGAAFGLVFLTAWHMLVARAGLSAGETVLVHAAGSGVGHAAVQIAKHLKATVYTTVGSEDKVANAKRLGADEVIIYTKEDFEERIKALTGGRGVDVVFEHIGPDTFEQSLRALSKLGRLVTCGATSGPSVPLDLRYVFSRQLSIMGSLMGTRAELNELATLMGQGALRPVVDAVVPLREARAAQERMQKRQVFGKLVLQP